MLCDNGQFIETLNTYILKNNGELDDAKMVLTDTIIAFSKQVFMNETFELEGDLNGYLFGIAKFKWFDQLRKNKKQFTVSHEMDYQIKETQESQLTLILNGERAQLLENILNLMRTRCKEVLMYWSGSYSMKEIAANLGYLSEGMARKKKSECMKELLTYLNDNPQIKQKLKV